MKLERVSTQLDFATEFAEFCGTVSSFFDASELSFSELQQEFESAAQDEEAEAEENGDEEDAVITEIAADSAVTKPAEAELETPVKTAAKPAVKTGEKPAKKKAEPVHDAESGAVSGGETKGLGHRSGSKHESRRGSEGC